MCGVGEVLIRGISEDYGSLLSHSRMSAKETDVEAAEAYILVVVGKSK